MICPNCGYEPALPAIIAVGDLRIDTGARTVTLAGGLVRLNPLMYDLLLVLAREPYRLFTKHELYERVWGIDDRVLRTRTLETHVNKVRRALGDGFIVCQYRVGYRLLMPEAVAA